MEISQKCLLRQNSQRSSLPAGCCAHLCGMSSTDPHFAEMQCSCWGYRPWKDPWVRPWPAGYTAERLSTPVTCDMNPDVAQRLRVLHTLRGLKVCAEAVRVQINTAGLFYDTRSLRWKKKNQCTYSEFSPVNGSLSVVRLLTWAAMSFSLHLTLFICILYVVTLVFITSTLL